MTTWRSIWGVSWIVIIDDFHFCCHRTHLRQTFIMMMTFMTKNQTSFIFIKMKIKQNKNNQSIEEYHQSINSLLQYIWFGMIVVDGNEVHCFIKVEFFLKEQHFQNHPTWWHFNFLIHHHNNNLFLDYYLDDDWHHHASIFRKYWGFHFEFWVITSFSKHEKLRFLINTI